MAMNDPEAETQALSLLHQKIVKSVEEQARDAARQLVAGGIARFIVTPGDSTIYRFVVIDQHVLGRPPGQEFDVAPGNRYAAAWNFGPLAALPDDLDLTPSYAMQFASPEVRNEHMGLVFSAVINGIRRNLEAGTERLTADLETNPLGTVKAATADMTDEELATRLLKYNFGDIL